MVITYLAAVVLSDPVVDTIRRELRRVSDVKVEADELRVLLKEEVIKREVLERREGRRRPQESEQVRGQDASDPQGRR